MADWTPPDTPIKKAAGGAWKPPDTPIAKAGTAEQPSWFQSLLGGAVHGAGDVVHSAMQLATHLGPSADAGAAGLAYDPKDQQKAIEDVDTKVRQRETAYQDSPEVKAHPNWAGAGRFGGEAAATTAAMGPFNAVAGAPGWIAKLLGGAALGAGGAVIGSPVVAEKPKVNEPPADFWTEKEKQAGIGAAAGGAVAGAGSAIGRAIAPVWSQDAAKLGQKGVRLTPGDYSPGPGGIRGSMEDRWQSWPILGDFIRNAKNRSLDTFINATINQALEPIGASLPKNAQAGTETVRLAGNALSKAYDEALSRVPSVMADSELTTALKAIETQARRNPDVWRKLEPALKHDIYEEFANAGRLEGRDVKAMISEQARHARSYRRSPDPDQRELGVQYEAVRDALKDAVKRQYPAEAPNIQAADDGWAMLTRIEQAASNRRGSRGRFTPSDLLAASKSQAAGVRRREFSRGDALLQEWATTAEKVLPSSIPDSGTAGRLLGAHPLSAIGQGGAYTGVYTGMMGALPRAHAMPGAGRSAASNLARGAGVAGAPAAGAATDRKKKPTGLDADRVTRAAVP